MESANTEQVKDFIEKMIEKWDEGTSWTVKEVDGVFQFFVVDHKGNGKTDVDVARKGAIKFLENEVVPRSLVVRTPPFMSFVGFELPHHFFE